MALVTGGPPPLSGYPQRVIERGLRAGGAPHHRLPGPLRAHRDGCVAPGQRRARLACDAPVIATGGDAPPYLQGSGLQLDERGFVLTGATLQSLSHPEVLAAGDGLPRADAPHPGRAASMQCAPPALGCQPARLPGHRRRAAAAPAATAHAQPAVLRQWAGDRVLRQPVGAGPLGVVVEGPHRPRLHHRTLHGACCARFPPFDCCAAGAGSRPVYWVSCPFAADPASPIGHRT
ncbi:MAG: hypothetical protein IPM99_18600 [Rubrivivax sp.]|nr:hypothetical protein [Rubrivivax sp.]